MHCGPPGVGATSTSRVAAAILREEAAVGAQLHLVGLKVERHLVRVRVRVRARANARVGVGVGVGVGVRVRVRSKVKVRGCGSWKLSATICMPASQKGKGS